MWVRIPSGVQKLLIMIKFIKHFWCVLFHINYHKIIAFYSNWSHRYHCSKCNKEWDENEMPL